MNAISWAWYNFKVHKNKSYECFHSSSKYPFSPNLTSSSWFKAGHLLDVSNTCPASILHEWMKIRIGLGYKVLSRCYCNIVLHSQKFQNTCQKFFYFLLFNFFSCPKKVLGFEHRTCYKST